MPLVLESRRRRSPSRTPWVVLALVAAVTFALLAGPRLGTFLIVSDDPVPSDATFLTYGVNIRKPALDAAIQRYAAGEGPHILVGALNSRDAAYYIVPHTSELVRQYLVDGGVPDDAIEILPSVDSETAEAERLSEAVAGRGWQRVVAYVPDFRARRAYGVLKRFLAPTGVEVRVVAVRDPEVRLERWWETRPGVAVIYNEYPRLLYYWLRGWL